MNLQTFRDSSMAGALQKVKKDLGRNAVILHTRTFKQGGILGLGGRNVVEITATPSSAGLPGRLARGSIPVRGDNGPAASHVAESKSTSAAPANRRLDDDVRTQMGQLRSLVEQMIDESRATRCSKVPTELFETYTHLVQQQVAEELARDLLAEVRKGLTGEQLRQGPLVQERLAQCVASLIPEGGPIQLNGRTGRPRVAALVGPTGVGKTTTIAKLAAHFKLREGKTVGLITIDTYRIAAVDQLKTYARIIDVPLEVVLSPEELVDAVARMRSMDLVLIDTAGRSQNDAIRLNELKSFLSAIDADEVHLVLSSTATAGYLRSAIERFGELGANRIIFTKLDEAVGFGVILEALKTVDQRLSYVTTGQDVPDDIEVGRARDLARCILGQDGAWAGSRTSMRS